MTPKPATPLPDKITLAVNWRAMFDAEHELTSRLSARVKELEAALSVSLKACDLALDCATVRGGDIKARADEVIFIFYLKQAANTTRALLARAALTRKE